MKKEKYSYRSLQERLRQEYKLYLLAFVFIVIADGIGVIKLPIWKGTFILFPIFYAFLWGYVQDHVLQSSLSEKRSKLPVNWLSLRYALLSSS